ncbi:MAG: hypothetical protein V4467_01140 [Patescibacteria group bacterium]
MENKKIIIGVAVLVVLVSGYFLVTGGGMKYGKDAGVLPNGKKMAFSELVKQNGFYKCDIQQNAGDAETSGVTYVHAGMIRGEYTTTVSGVTVGTNIIVRDGYTYSWTSLAPGMGFKAKVATTESNNGGAGPAGTYSFNADQIGDYNCQTVPSDTSRFTLPAGVTFKEL